MIAVPGGLPPCTIVQLTTVHPRQDTRVFHRQSRTLAEHPGLDLHLVVADGKGSGTEESDGVAIRVVDIGKPPGGRVGRMTIGSWRAIRAVMSLRARVAHFHDPELIPACIVLKLLGRRIVYDVHEDYPLQILHKHWLPAALRRPLAGFMRAIEFVAAGLFDAIVCANPKATERFPPRKTVLVRNFPIPSELVAPSSTAYARRLESFVYVGGIAAIRGAGQMVEAIRLMPGHHAVRLDLAGSFSPASLEGELRSLPGWERVHYHGWASRAQVAGLLGGARAGLVVLQPTQNYPDAYPVKMFEYMAAGLPVIASDFPLWRGIVDGAGCGLLVDPTDTAAIARAMQWILEHPVESEEMGRRGRLAVENRYNWSKESETLLRLYARLMDAS